MGKKGNWHYLVGGQQYGPATMDQIYALVSSGVIKGDTKVWCEGWSHWVSYADYTSSQDLQNTAQIARKRSRRKKRTKIALIVGGGLVLVAGGVIMIVMLASGGGGGHDSPEDLVDAVIEAADSGDASNVKALFPSRDDMKAVLDCDDLDDLEDALKSMEKEKKKVDREFKDIPSDFSVKLLDLEFKDREKIEKGTKMKGCTALQEFEGAKVRLHLEITAEGKTETDKERIELLRLGDRGWFLSEF